MALANLSFITDNTELFLFLEKKNIYELLTQVADDVVEDISQALTAEQQDRLQNACNWGKAVIVAGLREKYDFTSVTYSNADQVLKSLNARLAQWALEKRRYRNNEALTDQLEDLKKEIEDLALERSIWSLDIATQASPICTAMDSKSTQFDNGGQFDNLISSSERDDIWPDRANE